MDKAEKRRFIEDLCASVQEAAINAIPQMPEEWDGWELRELLADKFSNAAWMRQRKEMRKRIKDYKNEVITRNL